MVDALIILIVIILLFIALKGSVKHFKGEGSCCKGGSSILKTGEKKLDGPVVSEKRIRVSGMHCENCAGVTSARQLTSSLRRNILSASSVSARRSLYLLSVRLCGLQQSVIIRQ